MGMDFFDFVLDCFFGCFEILLVLLIDPFDVIHYNFSNEIPYFPLHRLLLFLRKQVFYAESSLLLLSFSLAVDHSDPSLKIARLYLFLC